MKAPKSSPSREITSDYNILRSHRPSTPVSSHLMLLICRGPAAIDALAETLRGVDILVLNTGGPPTGTAADITA